MIRVRAGMEWVAKNWSLDRKCRNAYRQPQEPGGRGFLYYLTLARCLHAYKSPVITDAAGVKHDWRIELVSKLASLQKNERAFRRG